METAVTGVGVALVLDVFLGAVPAHGDRQDAPRPVG